MNTNWSEPRTNIIAGMNLLRKALASGINARLVRAYNKDCAYPIKVKNKIVNDFREYTFTYGIPTSINKIKADTNLSDFEKHLSLNYVSVFGSQEARDRYYATGVCDKDNFKNMGCNHLVKVDDYIKFLLDTKDFQLANLYERQYRNPTHVDDVVHMFSFFRLRIAQERYKIKDIKRKVWVVEMLGNNEPKAKIPTLVHVLNFILKPLKYIPRKSVLQMPEYRVVTYRVGAVTNGLSIDIHVPKKFSFN